MSEQQATPANNDQEHTSAPQKVAVITTGGTIACTSDANGHLLPTVSGTELLASVAPRFDGTHIAFEVHEVNRLDSSSMTFADLDALNATVHKVLEDPQVIGVVVTHGTDSMEESAIAVDSFLSDPRPVVFTGAQKPFDHPDSDGPSNLFEASLIASDPSARGIGALVVFGRAVIPARGCTKWHTSDELAFATNGPEDPERPDALPLAALEDIAVEIIPAYPGADGAMVEAALSAGAQGLVVEGMGSGNVGSRMGDALGKALDAGIPVVMSTRVPRGEVFGAYGGAGGGATLATKGAVSSRYFRAGQARILLAVSLATGAHPATLF